MRGEARGTAIRHVDALDGARGMAVAGVLLFHGGHLRGGYLGVDFFFTLSGFLITSLLLAESSRTGSVGLGGFWARRARRLLPALTVLLAGVALYSWACASPDQLGQIRGDALATLGYVANWHEISSRQSYFALFTAPSPLNHTWSLAIEEQFYVIWPLLFVGALACWKRAVAKAVLVISLVLAGVSSVLLLVWYRPADVSRAYFGTDTRAAGILFGAALAAWLAIHGPTASRRRRRVLEATGLAGVAVLVVAWTRVDGQSSTPYRGGLLLCGLAATAIIGAAVHPEPGPVSRALSVRPLCALGVISYGVYLYHWPLDVFLDQQRVGFGGWPLFAVQTSVTLAVAVASYRFIEQPIRHGALSSLQLRSLTPAFVLGLVLLLVASTSANSSGSLFAAAGPDPSGPTAARAFRVAPPSSERVLVVGNSVAFLLGRAFEKLETESHLTVFDGGLLACTFPPEIKVPTVVMRNGTTLKGRPCDPTRDRQLVNGFRPQVVFWIFSSPTSRGGSYLGRHIQPCSEPWDSLYRRSLSWEVAVLRSRGAEVVITTSAYSRLVGLPVNDRGVDCDNRIRRRIAADTGARLIDLFEYICPHGQCREWQDGVKLRPDGLHYAGPGGEIVARWLLAQVGTPTRVHALRRPP